MEIIQVIELLLENLEDSHFPALCVPVLQTLETYLNVGKLLSEQYFDG